MAENIKKILEEYKDETKRHFDVVAEDVKDEIKIVAEQVGANAEKIGTVQEKLEKHDQKFESIQEKLEEHDGRFDKIEDGLEIIKLDIEFIKNELKQKVSHDEFAALEKRVSMLEAR